MHMKNSSLRMKANSRRRSRHRTVLAVGGVTLMLLTVVLFRGPIGGALAHIVVPIYGVADWLGHSVAVFPSFFMGKPELISENERLKKELAAARMSNGMYTVLEDENAELRTLLGDEGESPRTAAGVVARPPFVPYDTLIIDRGRRDGIVSGGTVYRQNDEVIGVIGRVFEHSALVTLLSSPGVESTVYIIGPDIYTTAYGEGDGTIRVSVPQGIVLTVGDIVILPSLDRGILGPVSTVRSESTRPEQSGYVVLETPIQSLRFVTVGAPVPGEVSFEEAREHVAQQKEAFFTASVPEGVLVDELATTSASSTVSDEGTEE